MTVIKKRYGGIKEASKYTSIPVKTLYEWASTGRMPSIKMGRRVLFDLDAIDKVMASLGRPYLEQDKTVDKIVGDIRNDSI